MVSSTSQLEFLEDVLDMTIHGVSVARGDYKNHANRTTCDVVSIRGILSNPMYNIAAEDVITFLFEVHHGYPCMWYVYNNRMSVVTWVYWECVERLIVKMEEFYEDSLPDTVYQFLDRCYLLRDIGIAPTSDGNVTINLQELNQGTTYEG